MGVVLTVALLASLILVAAPAQAAAPLQWNTEAVPGVGGTVLGPAGVDVLDIAVGADGTTIYAAPGATVANTVYKSTNGGVTWTPVSTLAGGMAALNAIKVAVAPDNNNVVAIANATTVYVSTNGGATWGTLGVPTMVGGGGACIAINDIDVSPAGPSNVVAVAGNIAGPLMNVWYYPLSVGGTWTDCRTAPFAGQQAATLRSWAVKFSPNFASDQVLTVVTGNATQTYYEMISLNQRLWNNNAAFGAGYPNQVGAGVIVIGASIALAPTYLGSDEVERVAFVGVNIGASAGIVYRLMDVNEVAIKTALDVSSVAYDGATVVAGDALSSAIWRSSNALEAAPTFYPTAATKSPGLSATATNTLVAFAGTNVVAGTTGASSAFAVSTDGGASFNDISLIDTVAAALGTMEDVAVSADGSTIYLVTNDTGDTSIWRYKGTSWTRVLTLAAVTGYLVRIAPDNADVVYVVSKAATDLYYSKAGGDTKWYTRTGPVAGATDFAVESDTVGYISGPAAGSVNIQKTSNGGFTWGPPTSTLLIAGNVYTITVISAGNILVGSTAGFVSYSTDGSMTWNPIPGIIVAGATSVQVTADGLASGSLIYATSLAADNIYRWQIGQSPTTPWLQIDAAAALNSTGIVLKNGTLYASSDTAAAAPSAIRRQMAPFLPGVPPPADNIAAAGVQFDKAPSALRVSSDATGNKLWAIDNVAEILVSFIDTMVKVTPTLSSPLNNTKVPINSIAGGAYTVAYTWPAIEGVTPGSTYQIDISLDSAFTQIIFTNAAVAAGPPVIVTVPAAVYNPGTTYYWRVKVSAPVSSAWSEVRTFTVESAPAVVSKIGTPVNGSTVTTTLPSFSWAPIGGTTKYQFQLTDDASFAATLVDTPLITTAYQAATDLQIGKTYFWRVKAIEPVEGDWSEVGNFAVAAPAPATTAAPVINVPNITIPPITVPPANVTVEAPTTQPTISAGLLWAVIIIGAVLVIALIVLIVRTRRTV